MILATFWTIWRRKCFSGSNALRMDSGESVSTESTLSDEFFGAFKIVSFSSISPRWCPRGLLDWSRIDLGRVLKGFWEDWRRSWEALAQFWMDFWNKIEEDSGWELKNFKRAATMSLRRTPALIREASQYVYLKQNDARNHLPRPKKFIALQNNTKKLEKPQTNNRKVQNMSKL